MFARLVLRLSLKCTAPKAINVNASKFSPTNFGVEKLKLVELLSNLISKKLGKSGEQTKSYNENPL